MVLDCYFIFMSDLNTNDLLVKQQYMAYLVDGGIYGLMLTAEIEDFLHHIGVGFFSFTCYERQFL